MVNRALGHSNGLLFGMFFSRLVLEFPKNFFKTFRHQIKILHKNCCMEFAI